MSIIRYTICMNKKLTKTRTGVYNINYHIIWTVKYRQKILKGEVKDFLKEELYRIAEDKGFTISAMETDIDHIHLFVSAAPKVSISYIIKMCKGISGRKMFLNFPHLKDTLWRGELWSNSYFVETIGSTNEEVIKNYIESQGRRG